MCGIAGYVSYENDFIEQRPLHENRVRKMGKTISIGDRMILMFM